MLCLKLNSGERKIESLSSTGAGFPQATALVVSWKGLILRLFKTEQTLLHLRPTLNLKGSTS